MSECVIDIFGLESKDPSFVESFISRMHEGDRSRFIAQIEKVVREITPFYFEGRFVRDDGRIINTRFHSRPYQEEELLVFYGIILDVSQEIRMKHQLNHSLKLKSIGEMAGGVAIILIICFFQLVRVLNFFVDIYQTMLMHKNGIRKFLAQQVSLRS